jgi:hypothetical protein
MSILLFFISCNSDIETTPAISNRNTILPTINGTMETKSMQVGMETSAVQPLLDYLQLKTPNLSSFLLMEESF